jgi:hypothetical protein
MNLLHSIARGILPQHDEDGWEIIYDDNLRPVGSWTKQGNDVLCKVIENDAAEYVHRFAVYAADELIRQELTWYVDSIPLLA